MSFRLKSPDPLFCSDSRYAYIFSLSLSKSCFKLNHLQCTSSISSEWQVDWTSSGPNMQMDSFCPASHALVVVTCDIVILETPKQNLNISNQNVDVNRSYEKHCLQSQNYLYLTSIVLLSSNFQLLRITIELQRSNS